MQTRNFDVEYNLYNLEIKSKEFNIDEILQRIVHNTIGLTKRDVLDEDAYDSFYKNLRTMRLKVIMQFSRRSIVLIIKKYFCIKGTINFKQFDADLFMQNPLMVDEPVCSILYSDKTPIFKSATAARSNWIRWMLIPDPNYFQSISPYQLSIPIFSAILIRKRNDGVIVLPKEICDSHQRIDVENQEGINLSGMGILMRCSTIRNGRINILNAAGDVIDSCKC